MIRSLRVVLGLAVAFAGCRFSASATDPYADVPPPGGAGGQGTGGPTDTGGTGGSGDTGGNGGTGGSGDTGGTGATDGSGGTGGTGGTATDGGTDSAAGGGGAGDSGGGSCQPATPPMGCDPVNNMGCLVPFSFCDIDRMQAVATGRCVFPWTTTPLPDAGCFMDMTSSTCAPTSTCVDGNCREICYCDSDCPGGQCCTEPAPGSSTTFKLCTPC